MQLILKIDGIPSEKKGIVAVFGDQALIVSLETVDCILSDSLVISANSSSHPVYSEATHAFQYLMSIFDFERAGHRLFVAIG